MTRARSLPRLALGAAIAGAAFLLWLHRDAIDSTSFESGIRNLGAWTPAGHVVLFALGTILFLPGAIFGLAGGLLFGPLWGTAFNLCGATLGATAAFLVGRYLAADWMRRRAGPRLRRLVDGVEAEGWRFVVFVQRRSAMLCSPWRCWRRSRFCCAWFGACGRAGFSAAMIG